MGCLSQGNQFYNYLLKAYADATPNINYLVRADLPIHPLRLPGTVTAAAAPASTPCPDQHPKPTGERPFTDRSG